MEARAAPQPEQAELELPLECADSGAEVCTPPANFVAQLCRAKSADLALYRWDGKCISLMADEVTLRRPPMPEAAAIAWKSLNEATREALLADRGIKFRRDLQRERCSNDSSAPRCTEATAALVRVIADYVRKGGKVPDPRLTVR